MAYGGLDAGAALLCRFTSVRKWEPGGPSTEKSDQRSVITPFNFTAIAGDLSTAPALMGNTVV